MQSLLLQTFYCEILSSFSASRLASKAFADVQPRFKEDEHRHGKQGLRDGVRRGQQHADGEGGEDDVRGVFWRVGSGGRDEHDEDDGRDRHFKRRAKGDEHRQAEVHVLGDVRLVFDALEFNAGEEAEEYRQDDEVGKEYAGVKRTVEEMRMGRTSRFSWRYMPGATNAHTW